MLPRWAGVDKRVDHLRPILASFSKREWQEAIGEARKKRQMKEAEGPQRLKAPPDLGDYLEGLGPTIADAKKKTIGLAGTFNAMQAAGLGAGDIADRIAQAAEETTKNTKRLVEEVQLNPLAFE